MEEGLLELLSPLQRLALSYAPRRAARDWLTFFAFDAKLAGIVRSAREETLARIRLAWWRERLQEPVDARPAGEPILARLADWPECGSGLVAVVDGWEALLGDEPLTAEAMHQFAEGRAEAMCILSNRFGLGPTIVGRKWAFAELATHLSDPAERALALELKGKAQSLQRCPREMRPLVVVRGVMVRAALAGRPVLSGPLDLLVAMRLGLLGM